MTIGEFKKMLDSVPEKDMDKCIRFSSEDYFFNSVELKILLEDVYYSWDTDFFCSANHLIEDEKLGMKKV